MTPTHTLLLLLAVAATAHADVNATDAPSHPFWEAASGPAEALPVSSFINTVTRYIVGIVVGVPRDWPIEMTLVFAGHRIDNAAIAFVGDKMGGGFPAETFVHIGEGICATLLLVVVALPIILALYIAEYIVNILRTVLTVFTKCLLWGAGIVALLQVVVLIDAIKKTHA
jgi:hypothetical protein